MSKDILKTLKKHLNGIDGMDFEVDVKKSKRNYHQFGEDIKSANEFIGALQIMDITLKKILIEAQKVDQDFTETNQQYSSICYCIEQLVEKCSFMGMELFDSTISTRFGGAEIVFDITSPITFVIQEDFESLKEYLEDKREEIKQKLSLISQRISKETVEEVQTHQSFEKFEFEKFAKMF